MHVIHLIYIEYAYHQKVLAVIALIKIFNNKVIAYLIEKR